MRGVRPAGDDARRSTPRPETMVEGDAVAVLGVYELLKGYKKKRLPFMSINSKYRTLPRNAI
jgi:hypothetical protein